MRLLLREGALRSARNAHGKTPAHLAATRLSLMSAAALRDEDASLPAIAAVAALRRCWWSRNRDPTPSSAAF